MFIPLTLVGLVGTATIVKIQRGRRGVSAEVAAGRKVVFQQAMNMTPPDAGKLRQLAQAFHDAGLDAEATMLIKRAVLAEMTPEQKAQRKQVFEQAMKSDKRDAILEMAALFEESGAMGAADALKQRAKNLEASNGESETSVGFYPGQSHVEGSNYARPDVDATEDSAKRD